MNDFFLDRIEAELQHAQEQAVSWICYCRRKAKSRSERFCVSTEKSRCPGVSKKKIAKPNHVQGAIMAATFSGALRLFTIFSVLFVLNAAQDSYNYHSRGVESPFGFSNIFYPSPLCLNLEFTDQWCCGASMA